MKTSEKLIVAKVVAGVQSMDGERLYKMVLDLQSWVVKKLETLPSSAPVAVQLMDGLNRVTDALHSKMSLTGKEAVAAFLGEVMEYFTLAAPPVAKLVKRYGQEEILSMVRRGRGGYASSHGVDGVLASELVKAAEELVGFGPMVMVNVGDLVDMGPYGQVYVTALGGNTVWVSSNPADIARGMGRAVQKSMVRRVVKFASVKKADFGSRRPENEAMVQFLRRNGINARVKYIWTGSLKGTWSLYNPAVKWTQELGDKLGDLGFKDFDGRPFGPHSGNGGVFSVFARGHEDMLIMVSGL